MKIIWQQTLKSGTYRMTQIIILDKSAIDKEVLFAPGLLGKLWLPYVTGHLNVRGMLLAWY